MSIRKRRGVILSRKRYAGKPLLYIQEIEDEKPNVEMQSTFYSQKHQQRGDYFSFEKKYHDKEDDNENVSFMRKKYPFFQDHEEGVLEDAKHEHDESHTDSEALKDDLEQVLEDESSQEQEKSGEPSKSNIAEKRFKDRTLQEKVDYFIERSSFAPMIRCIVKTELGDHSGWIAESTRDVLKIANRRRRIIKKINTSDILDIEIIGF